MRPLKIDCSDANWKTLLKRNLQDGIEVELLGFDYAVEGQFCEILAISHSMSFRLNFKEKAGMFKKTAPVADPKKGIISLPLPAQG